MNNNQAPSRHLDASGPREVIYCHQCDNEWYQDENGLKCPRCDGEITEIVTPESDPRPGRTPSPPPDFRDLHHHDPWAASSDVSDPEEADIEEHISHGPGGSIFISQTIRSNGRPHTTQFRRNFGGAGDPNDVMRDFQSMLGNLMGPTFRAGPSGRSGHDNLYPPAPMGFRLGGGGLPSGAGPRVVGGGFTFTPGRPPPRNDPQAPPDIATLLGSILGGMPPPGGMGEHEARGGMPTGLQGLFASLFNPANARSGDAVYTQEALDQIISTLMEQHPTSNAPGPASPDAISSLPKKTLDENLLGPEGKGECSVCMDDVHIGDEVVMLPCNHWFHEACASAWLGEHNTCPICRKGIEGDETPSVPASSNRRSSRSEQTRSPRHNRSYRRMSLGSSLSIENTGSRNEARLDSIRNTGRLSPTAESGPTRWQVVGSDYSGEMPGTRSSPRRRASEMSVDNQRDHRRGNTSGSDRSRDSRQSSGSAGGHNSSGSSGPIAWLRDRFSGGNDRQRRD